MPTIFLKPYWFTGYDIVFELLFGIVAFLVSFYAWKAFKLTKKSDLRLFAASFFTLAVAYFALGITNLLTLDFLTNNILLVNNILDIYTINLVVLGVYILLFLSALAVLAYTTIEFRDAKLFALIYIPILIGLLISDYKLFYFYTLSAFLLFFISMHYLRNYLEQKSWRSLFILTAFLLLFIGRGLFVFEPKEPLIYLTSHFIELGAYLLLFVSLARTKKK